ncbi:response regulator transcription factor [bacterium]|nr:response regulator transcription factor [bacterium]
MNTAGDRKRAPIRVVIADDHHRVRKALQALLSTHPEFEVVAEAADGVEAVNQVAETRPDVVLMDIRMPRMDGIEACRAIKKAQPDVAVFFLTLHDSAARGALSEGDAVILKGCPDATLTCLLREVGRGARTRLQ